MPPIIFAPPADLSTERLYQFIETKLHLLTEMRDMAIAQSDFVAQHDMTGLMTLLSRKQMLMESLQQVQTQLQPFQSQDPEARVWADALKRKRCQVMIAQCDTIVQNLIVMENHSLDNMTVQKELVVAQLQQNIDASTLQHAYHASDLDESLSDGGLSIEG